MNLILLFVLLLVGLFALLWGGAAVAQGYMYQQPADRLPARAAGGAVLIAAFLTVWVGLDRKSPGKYDTFFEFAGEKRTEFSEFEAVRWTAAPSGGADYKKAADGAPEEQVVKFRHGAAGPKGQFVQNGKDQPFKLNGTIDGRPQVTAAVVVTLDGAPVRFNSAWFKDPRTGEVKVGTYAREADLRRFVDDRGRYIRHGELEAGAGVVYAADTGVVVVALLLNLLLFLVWFAAFWPILRFSLGHAVGLAVVFGLASMLILMPLLFKPGRSKSAPPPAAEKQATRERAAAPAAA